MIGRNPRRIKTKPGVRNARITCPTCDGTGVDPETEQQCQECKGTGKVSGIEVKE